VQLEYSEIIKEIYQEKCENDYDPGEGIRRWPDQSSPHRGGKRRK